MGTHGQAGAGLFSTERALLPTRPAGEGGWQAERTGRRTGPACPGGCAFGLAAHTVQGRSCEGSRQGTLGPQPARRLPSCRDSTCHHGKGSFQVLRGRRTMVSNSYPVNRERRGTGTTRAIPSRTAATCSSNSWSLEEKAHFAFLRRCLGHLGVCFTDGAAQPEFTRRAHRGPPRKLRQHTIRDRARCPLPVPPEPQTRSIRPSWRPHGRALCKRAVPRPHCWRVWAPGGNGRRDSTARDTPRTTLPPSPASEARPALGASSQHRPGASGGEALRNLLRERGMSGGAAAGWLTCHTATAPQCWHEGHRGAA